MDVLILIGGKGARWNNFLGVPKHRITIDGEEISQRTVRLCKELGHNPILCDGSNDINTYGIHGEIALSKEKYTKFHDSMQLWKSEMALLYGDIWFSDEGIEKILSFKGDWAIAGRHDKPSRLGNVHKELFGFISRNEGTTLLAKTIVDLGNMKFSSMTTGSVRVKNLWGVQELLHNYPHLIKQTHEEYLKVTENHYIEVNDYTEDFDNPNDYLNFIAHKYLNFTNFPL